jgi:hypothetical protein
MYYDPGNDDDDDLSTHSFVLLTHRHASSAGLGTGFVYAVGSRFGNLWSALLPYFSSS